MCRVWLMAMLCMCGIQAESNQKKAALKQTNPTEWEKLRQCIILDAVINEKLPYNFASPFITRRHLDMPGFGAENAYYDTSCDALREKYAQKGYITNEDHPDVQRLQEIIQERQKALDDLDKTLALVYKVQRRGLKEEPTDNNVSEKDVIKTSLYFDAVISMFIGAPIPAFSSMYAIDRGNKCYRAYQERVTTEDIRKIRELLENTPIDLPEYDR